MVYYNRVPFSFPQNEGQLLVNFTHWDPREFYGMLAHFRRVYLTTQTGAQLPLQQVAIFAVLVLYGGLSGAGGGAAGAGPVVGGACYLSPTTASLSHVYRY